MDTAQWGGGDSAMEQSPMSIQQLTPLSSLLDPWLEMRGQGLAMVPRMGSQAGVEIGSPSHDPKVRTPLSCSQGANVRSPSFPETSFPPAVLLPADFLMPAFILGMSLLSVFVLI